MNVVAWPIDSKLVNTIRDYLFPRNLTLSKLFVLLSILTSNQQTTFTSSDIIPCKWNTRYVRCTYVRTYDMDSRAWSWWSRSWTYEICMWQLAAARPIGTVHSKPHSNPLIKSLDWTNDSDVRRIPYSRYQIIPSATKIIKIIITHDLCNGNVARSVDARKQWAALLFQKIRKTRKLRAAMSWHASPTLCRGDC